ncbi:hypothetical protein TRIADDRAFT_62910, partial [Trichoplax adhaerens]
ISEVLNINVKELEGRLINNKHFVWLKRHLTPTEQQKLHNLGIPGIYFINDQKRIYPQKNLFSHIVGLVDIDNNGISGLESFFDDYLKNSSNTDNIQTSLDTRIQYIVKQELNDVIKLHDAIGGTAIVMDVNSGEATLGVYEMGSVLKSLTLAIGIDSGEISLNDSFDVSTPIKIGNYKIGDYRGGKGVAHIIQEVGITKQKEYFKKL